MSVLEQIVMHMHAEQDDFFTSSDIAQATALPEATVMRGLSLLEKRGVTMEVCGTRGKWILRNVEIREKKEQKNVSGRDRMWKIMRSKKRFTRPDVARLAQCPMPTVETYFTILIHHGYLHKIGKDGKAHIYLFRGKEVQRPKLDATPAMKRRRK